MQLSSIRSKLVWLLLPALAIAATGPSLGRFGTGPLSLGTPEQPNTTSVNRISYCKHDDDPYQFISSRNYTFPDHPPMSPSFSPSAVPHNGEGEYTFDCFLEVPGGIVVFEIQGEIDSDFTLTFELWLSVLMFNYECGVWSCSLAELDEKPCAFNVDKKYFSGQGGLYPKQDPDPDWLDLCVELHGSVKIPYTRISKKVNFEKCFYRFPKSEQLPEAKP